MMYSLGQLELDTIMIVDLFEVYTILKTIFLFFGVRNCARLIIIEFLFP